MMGQTQVRVVTGWSHDALGSLVVVEWASKLNRTQVRAVTGWSLDGLGSLVVVELASKLNSGVFALSCFSIHLYGAPILVHYRFGTDRVEVDVIPPQIVGIMGIA